MRNRMEECRHVEGRAAERQSREGGERHVAFTCNYAECTQHLLYLPHLTTLLQGYTQIFTGGGSVGRLAPKVVAQEDLLGGIERCGTFEVVREIMRRECKGSWPNYGLYTGMHCASDIYLMQHRQSRMDIFTRHW